MQKKEGAKCGYGVDMVTGKTHDQTKVGRRSSAAIDSGHMGMMPFFFQETKNPDIFVTCQLKNKKVQPKS